MYDEDLSNLDEWIRRLKVEYDIFFNGNRKKPPDDLRMRVEKLVKKLFEASNMTYSQRFRFNTLVTRYYVYRDLWRRAMAERELATAIKDKPAPGAAITAPNAQAELPMEAVRISISDPEAEKEKVQQLYDALLRIREKHAKDSPSISYEQFATFITTQILGIRGKQGCTRVAFAIALEEDAIRFTAKAEHPR